MSRLDYAPKLKEIKVTDIKKGIGVFTPKPDKPVSFAALKETLKKAGYTLDSANLRVAGKLVQEGKLWFLVDPVSGQRFTVVGNKVDDTLQTLPAESQVEIEGDWKTIGAGKESQESVTLGTAKEVTVPKPTKASLPSEGSLKIVPAKYFVPGTDVFPDAELVTLSSKPAAPIRVTSPGLTVYKGGAVTPRLYFIKQHLGNLDVNRQILNFSVSYTPSPRVQLEAEVPISRTSFEDGVTSGSRVGLGNVTLWTKYRFFRKVKIYGDRQASARFGLELPTGKSDAPNQARVNAPAFVRQQLTPVNGGLSPHFDVSFSQAGGRLIFGGNVEVIARSERDGFRMGHELRVNTDLEYVVLPRKYDAPGGELFMILETSFVYRGTGRNDGFEVPGSKATEYYVAPGLQYAAHPQFVVEGSVQLPVVRNTGSLVLRNDRNILLGVRYLF
ncbi:MAG: hypothetical protein ABR568_10500 [Pyrinomonadaceae bacterium]